MTALHPPSAILPRGSSSRIIDVTDSVPGYGDSTDGLMGLEKRIRAECKSSHHWITLTDR